MLLLSCVVIGVMLMLLWCVVVDAVDVGVALEVVICVVLLSLCFDYVR